MVPYLPYYEYVWCPDFDGYRSSDIKIILDLPSETTFEFIDYDTWKYNYYKK